MNTRYLGLAILLMLLLAVPGSQALAKGQQVSCNSVIPRVEQIRHLRFKHPVQQVFLTREQFRHALEQESEQGLNRVAVRNHERVLKLFGFLPQSSDLLRLESGFRAQAVGGFYSLRTRKLYLPSETGKLDALTRSSCAHELTHALQDQNFDIKGMYRHVGPHDSDGQMAIKSLIEGDAQAVQATYVDSTPGLAEQIRSELAKRTSNQNLTRHVPTVLVEDFYFPYEAGDRFVTSLYREGGFGVLNKAYINPPVSTEQIIYPAQYLHHQQPTSVELPNLSSTLGRGWSELEEDDFGELGVIVLLAGPRFSPEAVRAAVPKAKGWRGDRYAVYASGGREAALWRTVWDNPGDAKRFEAALRRYDEGRFGARYGESHGELRLETPSRTAIIATRGSEVTYVIAPDPKLARGVLSATGAGPRVPNELPQSGGGGMAQMSPAPLLAGSAALLLVGGGLARRRRAQP